MYRGGLDRFKKAQTLEPFSVTKNATSKAVPAVDQLQNSLKAPKQHQQNSPLKPEFQDAASTTGHSTQVGGGQSTWQPPDWAIEPRPGVHYLEVLKDGEVIDRINLDRRRHIFGRQIPTCDFILDHQSVSRQHAAVVPHKNGSIYVIDLGSVHGTFVANERLTKDSPVELEVGQSLRFAASTRCYILRKNTAALFPPPPPTELNLPSPPDPNDEDSVVAYNTILNRYGISKLEVSSGSKDSCGSSCGVINDKPGTERPAKRTRKARVAFKDQFGGELAQVVGTSDGADVETEPGPIGVKEGSLVGKYESLVQVTVIPKGKEQITSKDNVSPKGVTDKLQQVLNRVKGTSQVGIYDDLFGDSSSENASSSWAYKLDGQGGPEKDSNREKPASVRSDALAVDDNDDLFGDT